MLVASFVKDVACEMISEPTFHVQPQSSFEALSIVALAQPPQTEDKEDAEAEDGLLAAEQKWWPEQSRSWRKDPTEEKPVGELMPGLWSTPIEYGILPRLRDRKSVV